MKKWKLIVLSQLKEEKFTMEVERLKKKLQSQQKEVQLEESINDLEIN